jgi:aminopeptidase N
MKYRNPRTGHTIAVELVVLEYAVVERDWEGKIVAILAEDESKREAQRKLDSLAKSMNWEEA